MQRGADMACLAGLHPRPLVCRPSANGLSVAARIPGGASVRSAYLPPLPSLQRCMKALGKTHSQKLSNPVPKRSPSLRVARLSQYPKHLEISATAAYDFDYWAIAPDGARQLRPSRKAFQRTTGRVDAEDAAGTSVWATLCQPVANLSADVAHHGHAVMRFVPNKRTAHHW